MSFGKNFELGITAATVATIQTFQKAKDTASGQLTMQTLRRLKVI